MVDDGELDAESLYEGFATWAEGTGRALYPHQEEALLEISTGSHVIVSTPTGSGKTMIALAAHQLIESGARHPSEGELALDALPYFPLADSVAG